MLKGLLKLKKAIMTVYSSVAAVALFVLIICTFVQVVGRYIFNSSPAWTEEFARYAFIWFGSLGAAVALDKNLHASISVFTDMLPKSVQKYLAILMKLMIVAISVLMIITGLQLTKATLNTPSPAIRLPMAWVNVAIVFCGIGMVATSVYSILESLFGKKEESLQGGDNA